MGLDLDEIVYARLSGFMRRKKRKTALELPQRQSLAECKSSLSLLASALCGEAIELHTAEREGGYKGQVFFLPDQMSFFAEKAENLRYYHFRVAYLSVQRQLQLNWQQPNDSDVEALHMARETAEQVLVRLFDQYPSLKAFYDMAGERLRQLAPPKAEPEFAWLYGKWMYAKPTPPAASTALAELAAKNAHIADNASLRQARAVESQESVNIDKKQQEDYVFTHNFEKVETAEEFDGLWRDFDGSDEIEDHHEALEELRMRFTVRVDDEVHAIYQADFVENTTVAESASRDESGYFVSYHEWDHRKASYLADYCRVYPQTQLKANVVYTEKVLREHASVRMQLRKLLANMNNKFQLLGRQTDGHEFQLDALTDLYTDLMSGHSPAENIYLSQRKRDKDLSLLLLLDLSLSSDGFAAGNRVLDVEKEVSLLFGELLNEFCIDFAVDAFNSKTRHHTNYITLKEFTDDWQQARHRIGAAEAGGYTRIGAALRHAGARLGQRPAHRKWVIILSDGKPNDFDRYEGQHGIQDVRQALRELNQQGMEAYALAIEAQARHYLPQMFGQNHYQILTNPNELLTALVRLYEKIKKT